MAAGVSNYPTSLDNYTEKTALDEIQSKDVNDLQAAIEAVEGELGNRATANTWTVTWRLRNAASSNPGHTHTGAPAHNVMSASHTDTDQTTTPATGDILIREGGKWNRLAIGSAGFSLQVSGGKPAWLTRNHNLLSATHGDTDTTATPATGDLLARGPNNQWDRIPVGSEDQVLTMFGGQPRWETPTAGGGGTTTVYIPASAMHPSTTNGAAVEQVEYATNDQDIYDLAFDTTTQEYGQFTCMLPSTWNAGTITAKFHWTNGAGAATQQVRLGIQGYCYSDDDALDVAWGTAQEVTDAWLAQNDMHISAATPAITIGGTVATGKTLQFRVYRNPAHADDNMAGDLRLIGIELTFTNS